MCVPLGRGLSPDKVTDLCEIVCESDEVVGEIKKVSIFSSSLNFGLDGSLFTTVFLSVSSILFAEVECFRLKPSLFDLRGVSGFGGSDPKIFGALLDLRKMEVDFFVVSEGLGCSTGGGCTTGRKKGNASELSEADSS